MNAYFTLTRLTEPMETDLGSTFQRMAELLEGAEETAVIQFQILGAERPQYWTIEISPRERQVRTAAIEHPDFEIVTRAETWWQIAKGTLSPFRAFTQGKMRVRGNIDLGQRVLQRLASQTT